MESWNNSACLGYLVMALESAGFPADEIQRLAAIVRETTWWRPPTTTTTGHIDRQEKRPLHAAAVFLFF